MYLKQSLNQVSSIQSTWFTALNNLFLGFITCRNIAFTTLILIFSTGSSQATILEFDQIRLSNGIVVPTISGNAPEPDYGDRVNISPMNVPGGQYTYGNGGEGFTPNVVLDMFSGSAVPNNPAVTLWQQQYGDLTNVLIGNNNSQMLSVQLTADASFAVQLYHFELAGWPNTDYIINSVQVLSGLTPLFSQASVLVEGDAIGPMHTSFDFVTPLIASELLIQIDYSNLAGDQHDNIGIDNIRFGQTPPVVVPIPAAWLLFFSALTSLAFCNRTRT